MKLARSMSALVMVCVLMSGMFSGVVSLSAQGRAGAGGSQEPAGSALVEVREVRLTNADVDREHATGDAKGGAGLPGLRNGRLEAAQAALKKMAKVQLLASSRTVVVVIGSEGDKERVTKSLAGVTRRVLVLWADTNAKGAGYDNSALKGSLLDRARTLQNVWVYLPKAAKSADAEPSVQLAARLATGITWTTLFTADGDVPTLSGLRQNTGKTPDSVSASAAVPADASLSPAGLAPGAVVTTRIAGVKLLAQPADSAQTLASLVRGEELVVTGGPTGDFIKVQSAAAEGWVKRALITGDASSHPSTGR